MGGPKSGKSCNNHYYFHHMKTKDIFEFHRKRKKERIGYNAKDFTQGKPYVNRTGCIDSEDLETDKLLEFGNMTHIKGIGERTSKHSKFDPRFTVDFTTFKAPC